MTLTAEGPGLTLPPSAGSDIPFGNTLRRVGDDRTDMDPATELAADFALVAGGLSTGKRLEETLHLVVAAAVEMIPDCQHAGVLLYVDGQIEPMASSDPLVAKLDQIQVDVGEGPCLDTLLGAPPYVGSDDLADDPAFPVFGPRAAELGARSALGLRLLAGRRLGALNLYSPAPHAFGVADRAKAVILASHCATAIDIALNRAEEEQANRDDLDAALASRAVIGQAQGILMERERITADDAFDVLRRASQELNVKLRDVAQRLVDTGEDPRSRAAGEADRRDGTDVER